MPPMAQERQRVHNNMPPPQWPPGQPAPDAAALLLQQLRHGHQGLQPPPAPCGPPPGAPVDPLAAPLPPAALSLSSALPPPGPPQGPPSGAGRAQYPHGAAYGAGPLGHFAA